MCSPEYTGGLTIVSQRYKDTRLCPSQALRRDDACVRRRSCLCGQEPQIAAFVMFTQRRKIYHQGLSLFYEFHGYFCKDGRVTACRYAMLSKCNKSRRRVWTSLPSFVAISAGLGES